MLEKFDAYQLAKRFHFACKAVLVPSYLGDQLPRASASVVFNIAEATGRRTPQDQRRLYAIAFGSLREAWAILDMEAVEDSKLLELADRLAAILYTLSRKRSATENQTATDTATATATATATVT